MAEVIVLFDGYSKKLGDSTMDANCSCTLIKAEKNIIVDTMTAWDREKIFTALAEKGLKPEDIHYVVCTHSHADHIGNNNLFLNAEHIVGQTVHRGTTFCEKDIKNVDYHLCEGVKVTATPGHTAEDVSVIVDAKICEEIARVVVTGDLFEKEKDIKDPSIWQSLGIVDLRNVQAQMRSKILDLADYIVPGHGTMFRVTNAMRDLVKTQASDLIMID